MATFPSPTIAEIEGDVSSFLEAYITAFNKGDLEEAASYYDEPCAFISASSGVRILYTQEDYVKSFIETVDRLKAEGWTHSEFVGEKAICALDSDRLVLVSCPCKRLRADGSSVEEFTAIYTLRTVDGCWKICSLHHGEFGKVLRQVN